MTKTDVIIIGASAAGLMCAIESGKRGRNTLVLDHANKVGKKILMSGGGRCNFTNYNVSPDKYISHNPHFCKSALSRYTCWDFIALVEKHGIPYHEKTLGQLFCDNKSKDIVTMLLKECEQVNAEIKLNTSIQKIQNTENGYDIKTNSGEYFCESFVVATGGLSIPTLGATGFGYEVAKQFRLKVYPTRAALVPFTLTDRDKKKYSELSGISTETIVTSQNQTNFKENILFTHRGLSGPAILQISSYWHYGEPITINLLPNLNDFYEKFSQFQNDHPDAQLKTFISQYLPKRLAHLFSDDFNQNQLMKTINEKQRNTIIETLQNWEITPNGTEGYRTAEVTIGGVDCDEVSSKTMEAIKVKGLYFIGEVLDVTGWLGGYNFQWAWASGWCAGQVV